MARKDKIYVVHLTKPSLPQYRRKNPTYVSAVSRRKVTWYTKSEFNALQNKQSKKSYFDKRSDFKRKKSIIVADVQSFAKILGFVIIFLLLASFVRRASSGTIPSFSQLLAYLSSFDAPTIPFNNQSGLVLGTLEFIFLNATQGLLIFLNVIKFMFFG